MIKVLGLADIMAGAIFLAQLFAAELPASMVLFFAAYLILKGGLFATQGLDIASAGDVLAGAALAAIPFFAVPFLVVGFFAIFLFQKGLFAVVSQAP